MSTISASTTSTTAYTVTADTTGTLVLQTGATPTTAVTVSSAQVVTLTNALPVASGGTGATSASAARTSLGLVIGTDVLAPTGSAASLTSFPTFNQSTTGSAATVTGNATGSTFGFNSGYGSVATAYGCRAWANFTGVGSVSIRGSGNVSSIAYTAAGKYTVNLSSALTDANYALALGICGLGNSGGGKLLVEDSSGTGGTIGRTSSAFVLISSYSFSNPGGATTDNAYSNSVAVFR
jgi:hypothetical protein